MRDSKVITISGINKFDVLTGLNTVISRIMQLIKEICILNII